MPRTLLIMALNINSKVLGKNKNIETTMTIGGDVDLNTNVAAAVPEQRKLNTNYQSSIQKYL